MKTSNKIIILSIILTLLSTTGIFAQMHDGNFGNEWINHSQEYYKFNVIEDGFYTIDKTTLQNTITNFQQVNPQNIQLFYMGQEVPVYAHVVNGTLEYISFYAEKNKGEMDVNLYRRANHHFNPEYSLISDVATYFLTWKTSGTANQYQTQNSNFNAVPAKDAYFMHESKTVLTNSWNSGKYINISGTTLSNGIFEFGEGYGSAFNKTNIINVNTPNPSTVGPAPTVNVRAYAFGFSNHTMKVTTNSHVQSYTNYYGDSVVNVNMQVGLADINPTSTDVKIEGLAGTADKYAVSVVSITYPRTFDFEGKSQFKFKVASSFNKKYLEINNFDGGMSTAQNVYLYDMTNRIRIECLWDGTKVHAVLPASASDRELILVNEGVKKFISTVNTTDFKNYNFGLGDYIVISHPQLFLDSEGNNPVLDYCAYRSTTGHLPVLVPIQRLYDQFSYGIKGHPMAIKNFATYIKQHWLTNAPKNIFLIGKGLNYRTVRTTNSSEHLIPTFGYPPSDNLLLAPIGSDAPVIPVGRLAATNGDQVRDYLNKIKRLESSAKDSLDFDNQNWRKQTIHLGGGANVWENNIIKNHLLDIEPTMENGKFGAQVHSFFKEQDEHISIPNSQMIDSLVNNGVSLVTFFGHGSVKGFDFYLNAPDHYSNKDKYPVIMALGCYNGTIFESSKLMSERFIFEKEAGAIGYIAFVDAVTISIAKNLSSTFYNHANEESYGAGIGELLQKTLNDVTMNPSYGYNVLSQMGCQYLVYHGDPAVKLNYRSTPDFHIDEEHIATSPKVITEEVRNFILEVDIHNFGKYQDSSMLVKVVRTHPSGMIDTSLATLEIPKNKVVAKFLFPVNGYEDFGLNKFSIYVDADNSFDEQPNPKAESNNIVLNYEVWIGNPSVSTTYPKEFSIIQDSVLTLRAMTTNAFETQTTWFIELDTTENFNSPFLMQTTSQTNSNLSEWAPNVSLENNQVYYWRVQVINASQQTSDWSYSSFVYLPATVGQGWNQSHVHQFLGNDFDNMHIEETNVNKFQFSPTLYEISAKTGFVPEGIDNESLALYQNGSKVDKCRCPDANGVYVAVFDPNALSFWTMPGGSTQYGAVNCDAANRTAYSFLFQTSTLDGLNALSNFVTNTIPDGHLVIVYTLNNGHGQTWSAELVNHLKSQGASKIDYFVNTTEERSYGIAYRKGDSTYPYFSEEVGYEKSTAINVYSAAYKEWDQGRMTSALIGPAQSWDKLEWSATQLEMPLSDLVSVDVWGVDENGAKQLLQANIYTDTFDLSAIDANQYPYLQLVLNNKDDLNRTAAQLDYWRVYGDLYRDAALTVEKDYVIEYDSINNQQNIIIDLAVWNMGSNLIDSAELEFMIVGEDTSRKVVTALYRMDSTNVQINIPIIGLIGQQHLVAKVKPLKQETALANNWGWLEFNVPNVPEVIAQEEELAEEDTEKVIDNLNNFPNPFSNQTQIEFDINGELPDEVSIQVYDIRGTMIQSTFQYADNKNYWVWNGKNEAGENMPTGMYFCKVTPIYDNVDAAFDSKLEQLEQKAESQLIKMVLSR